MKKYFTKLALVIGCVGSMCFLGGNTLASTKEIVSDMETFNRAREAVAEELKEAVDLIRVINEDEYRKIKMLLVKGDIVDIIKDTSKSIHCEDLAKKIEDILKETNEIAEKLNAEAKYEVWKVTLRSIAIGWMRPLTVQEGQ